MQDSWSFWVTRASHCDTQTTTMKCLWWEKWSSLGPRALPLSRQPASAKRKNFWYFTETWKRRMWDLQSVTHTLNIPVSGIIQTLGTHFRSSCSKLQLEVSKKSFAASEGSLVQTQYFSLKAAEGINRLKLDHVTRRVRTGNSLDCFEVLSTQENYLFESAFVWLLLWDQLGSGRRV